MPPSFAKVHGALFLQQSIFGVGSVIGKLGLSDSTNPVVFALVRESLAGPILAALAWRLQREALRERAHALGFLGTGTALFMNQLLYMIGLKLSTALVASLWQPSQPLITAAIAVAIGAERLTPHKAAGLALAVGGAVFMVLYGAAASEERGGALAQALFFGNCLGTSLYVILARPLLQHYDALTVTGWSYMVASLLMLVAATVINTNAAFVDFVCGGDCAGSAWAMDGSAWLAELWWVLFNSVAAYFLMTWANQFVDASVTIVYTVVQPVVTAILSYGLRLAGVKGMDSLGLNDLGALGIVAGLVLIVRDPASGDSGDSGTSRAVRDGGEEPLLVNADA